MIETIAVMLAVATLVLVLVAAAMASSTPFIWWKLLQQEVKLRRVEQLEAQVAALDDAVAMLSRAAGIGPAVEQPVNGAMRTREIRPRGME